MRRLALLPLLALAAMLAAAPARAQQFVFDDISGSRTQTTGLTIGNDLYASFTNTAGPAQFSQVTLHLGNRGSGTNGVITVGLYSQSTTTGLVGSILGTIGTINDSNLSTSYGAITLSTTSTFLLAAGTRYFIGLIDSGTSGAWMQTSTTTGVTGEYHNTNNTGVGALNNTVAYMMQVAVP